MYTVDKALIALLMAGCMNAVAWPAYAYEYALVFTPAGNYEDLVVAGYSFSGKTVVGNCSYTQITSGSGRDPRTSYTPVPQTCTWDFYGNLLSVASGAPTPPAPLATQGTETIYARKSKNLYAGADSATGYGFVFLYGAHYAWLTPNPYLVLPQQPYTFTITLQSNGDIPLKITRVKASTAIAATPDTPATTIVINSSSCTGLIAANATCSITLTYNDAGLTSPSGLAYDTVTVHLTTNTGATADFVQHMTDEVAVPSDN